MHTNDVAPPPLAYVDLADGRRLAYRHREPAENRPTVLFLPGYASDMEGSKASAIDRFCSTYGIGCLRFDYSGTGESPGEFADGTLDRWLDETLEIVDRVAQGSLIVVGSSMGGWIAIHAALRRKDRIKALMGIAAAPDFTDWGYSGEEKKALMADGRLERPNPYGDEPMVTHRDFWVSGTPLRVLYSPIDLTIPVRLIHGEKDEDVPMGVPIKLLADLNSSDVQLNLIKNGGHRLSEPHEIHAILVELVRLLELVL